MVLVRHLLGGVLRRQRMRQGRTLRQVSADAQVSLGYISEVERGQKEASSELLAAICTALEVPLSAVLRQVSQELAMVEKEIGPEPARDQAFADQAFADQDFAEPEFAVAGGEQELVPAGEQEFAMAGEPDVGQGVPTALAKRLETRRLDSERLADPENHPDVVAAA